MKLYKYTFKSPLRGSIQCEKLFSDTDGSKELDSEDMARLCSSDHQLCEFLENNREDLTEYICASLKTDVRKMEVGDYGIMEGELCLLSYVWVEEELTEAGMQEVMDYLTGQLSDGWGEGLAQRHWRKDIARYSTPYFDTYSSDWEGEDHNTEAYFYVSPWYRRGFTLELDNFEIEEVADPEPVVQSARCELMPNGGYKVRTVYQLNNEAEGLNYIKNSGLLYSDDFYIWMKQFGTFGRDIKLYSVVVNEGLCNKILPILGVKNEYPMTTQARLFIMNTESGTIDLEEYLEDELMDFFNDLLHK
jgi:hypothetical protein